MTEAPEGQQLLITNADIRTQTDDSPRAPAMLVAGGRIRALGDPDDMRRLAGPEADTLDLDGRLVLPGFFDSHFHFYQWALGRQQIELAAVATFGQCLDTVRAAAERTPPGQWLLGSGFNESDWPEHRMPVAADLDQAAPDHPAIIWRCDLHVAVANSRAMALAGIDADTPNPLGGDIERGQGGQPTGVVREGAINLVKAVIPELAEDSLAQAMADGVAGLHALGITALHDVRLAGAQVEASRTLRCWQRLRREGRLDLRLWAAIPGESLDEAVALGLQTGLGDDRLRIGHVKFFLDGGMGARTAWTIDPYADTGKNGLCLYPPEELLERIRFAHEHGLAVMAHAIGDRANQELVAIYEKLFAESNARGPALQHGIEHAQLIRAQDVARLGRLPVDVSAQPSNLVLDINMIERCMPGKAANAYPFRAMLDASVSLMFSSDCPVCDPSPLAGIQAAVTRARSDRTPDGGWQPQHKVSVAEAVRAFTATPARTHGQAGLVGTIAPGAKADFIVLSKNIYEIDPFDIARTRVDLTVFDGCIVHQAE